MKTTLLLVSVVAFVATTTANVAQHDRRQFFSSIHDECQATAGTTVDKSAMDKFFRGELTDESKIAKYTLCMNVKTGIQKENGDVDQDGLRQAMGHGPIDKINDIIANCGHRKDSDAEKAALALVKCINSNKPSRPTRPSAVSRIG